MVKRREWFYDPDDGDERGASSALYKVLRRDQGICKLCGVNTYLQLEEEEIPEGRTRPWDMDHKIPMALGGRNTLKNLQTLCLECHAEKTKADNKEIRRLRKAGQLPKLNTNVQLGMDSIAWD